jgi:hypothetical protein
MAGASQGVNGTDIAPRTAADRQHRQASSIRLLNEFCREAPWREMRS